jgi:outer membrane protein assembly factor BamB
MAAALALTSRLLDPSIATGMMGMMLPIVATPVLSLAFVAWAAGTRKWSAGFRRAAMALTIFAACLCWTLARTNGLTSQAASDLAWRWAPTAEDRLLADPAVVEAKIPAAVVPAPVVVPAAAKPAAHKPATLLRTAEWPGFRGPNRDDHVPGRTNPDWSANPPMIIWHQPVGPGWSSFAVRGDLFYTQEQRGAGEVVSCYRLATGEPVWKHADEARFWESNAGAGPRATPALAGIRVYTFGATGILNALDAATGAVVWSRNVSADTGVKIPEWGFASSPLVMGDVVVVAAAGKLAAYDLATGKPRWSGPDGHAGYSSPHRVTLDGVEQIVLLSTTGAVAVSPADGAPLWSFVMPPAMHIVQPAVVTDNSLLLSEDEGHGMRRITLAHGSSGWTATEDWRSIGLKPYFSDFVIHKGHAFGFDNGILACIDVQDGKRAWKGGRYGSGQLLLLPDADLLLATSEEGELVLVAADPAQFKELARVPGIEGKTWNHPVLAGDVLLVRNGQEMAAFRLAMMRP